MVSRTSEAGDALPAPRPSSRTTAAASGGTPATPTKPRLGRLGTSPSKREEKSRDESGSKGSKSSAKDVAELQDYVCRSTVLGPPPLSTCYLWGADDSG